MQHYHRNVINANMEENVYKDDFILNLITHFRVSFTLASTSLTHSSLSYSHLAFYMPYI